MKDKDCQLVSESSEADTGEVTNKIVEGVSGFALVAGYGDSENDDDTDEIQNIFISKSEPLIKNSHSTLFPITKTLDVEDFEPKIDNIKEDIDKSTDFEPKTFQRKKRISVALINAKEKVDSTEISVQRRPGLGFDIDSAIQDKAICPNPEKNRILFVKSSTTELSLSDNKSDVTNVNNESKEISTDKETIEAMYSNLIEKLHFLSSVHSMVPPTQIMAIQAEVR